MSSHATTISTAASVVGGTFTSSTTSPLTHRDVIARRRWYVHLLLIASLGGVTVSAVFLSKRYFGYSGVTDHAILGAIVLGLVLIHLYQRRQTVLRLASRLVRLGSATAAQSKLAVSDLILLTLTINAMASGLADYISGQTILFPIQVPSLFQKWHLTSVLVLLVYAAVHVIRRSRRLRSSHVR